MDSENSADPGLPTEARATIWKILGSGQSPLTERSTLDLIEPILRAHISSPDQQNLAIAIVRDWIELVGEREYLNLEKQGEIAELVFEGIGINRSEQAVWAIGSIDCSVSLDFIRSNWSTEEVESFVEGALAALERACLRDEVLSAFGVSSIAGDAHHRTRIRRSALKDEGRILSFHHLSIYGFELVHHALHPPIANLIELVIDLQPEKLGLLIERLDHPVIQMRASQHMLAASRTHNHRQPLDWIAEDSCDALIALSVLHTLETVNLLDSEIRHTKRDGDPTYVWNSALKLPRDDLDAAAENLIKDLVTQLATLDTLRCMEWIGELLSGAKSILEHTGSQRSLRCDQLETYCTEQIAPAVHDERFADLLEAFLCGLRQTTRPTWSRHVAEWAWFVRKDDPDHAAFLAKVVLDDLDHWIGERLLHQHLYWNLDDREQQQWIVGLGLSLSLVVGNSDVLPWVSSRCRNMPLSVWDAEEDLQSFLTADKAAQLLLLVGFQSIEYLMENDRDVDDADVRLLAETVWNHCGFTGQISHEDRESSVVAEYAARSVIEFGDPSERWLMNQASNPNAGPGALWALIDQLSKRKTHHQSSMMMSCVKPFVHEFAYTASKRYGNGASFDFHSLTYWGRLWLLVEDGDLAHSTALAILTYPWRIFDRSSKILVLNLLCASAKVHNLDTQTVNRITLIYRDLWPSVGYSPDSEKNERQRMDQMLRGFGISPP